MAEQQLDRYLRVLPEGRVASEALRSAIARERSCRERTCLLVFADDRTALLAQSEGSESDVSIERYRLDKDGRWSTELQAMPDSTKANPASAQAEIRTVQRRQLFIDGKPVGLPFE